MEISKETSRKHQTFIKRQIWRHVQKEVDGCNSRSSSIFCSCLQQSPPTARNDGSSSAWGQGNPSFLASRNIIFGLDFAGRKGTEEAEDPPAIAKAALPSTPGAEPRGAAGVRTRGQQCQSHPPPPCALQPPATHLREECPVLIQIFLTRNSLYTGKEEARNKITGYLILFLYTKLGAAYQSQEQSSTKPNLSPFCCCFEDILKHRELHPGADGCLQGSALPQCYLSKHAWLGLGRWSPCLDISGL